MTNKGKRRLDASCRSVLNNSAFSWSWPGAFQFFSSLIAATISSLVGGSTLMFRSSGASWMCGISDGLSVLNTSSIFSAHRISLFVSYNCVATV